jgi:hypothetical protein
MVLYPTTGGQTSYGTVSHGLTEGAWVVGFFVDGEDSQQPVILGVINGGPESINNSSVPTGSQTSGTGVVPSNPNEAYGGDFVGQPSTTQLTGGDNPKKVYNYFWERISKEGSASGDKKVMCAALVGNFQIESGDSINPQAFNPNDRGEASMGIAQWRAGKYDRATPFLKFCGVNGQVRPPNLPPLEKQLDYVWHEFHTTEKTAYGKLLVSTTIQDAVAAMIYYERDASYKKINGYWTVDRNSPFYLKKLNKARAALSSLSYTGNSV